MSYYYIRTRLASQQAVMFSGVLSEKGFGDRVDYHPGGWADHVLAQIDSHLRFGNAEDALAYSLAYGGEVLTEIPVREQIRQGD